MTAKGQGQSWTVGTHTKTAHTKAWRLVGEDLLRKLHPRGPEYAATLEREHLYSYRSENVDDARSVFSARVHEALSWCTDGGRDLVRFTDAAEWREHQNRAYAVTVERWVAIFNELADEVLADFAKAATLADEARRRVVSLEAARARRAERWRPWLDRSPGPLTAAGQGIGRRGVVLAFVRPEAHAS